MLLSISGVFSFLNPSKVLFKVLRVKKDDVRLNVMLLRDSSSLLKVLFQNLYVTINDKFLMISSWFKLRYTKIS